MTPHGRYFEDEADIYCTETEKTVTADVIDFLDKRYLIASLNRAVKVNLQWNEQHSMYLGKAAGLEFQSHGPKRII